MLKYKIPQIVTLTHNEYDVGLLEEKIIPTYHKPVSRKNNHFIIL